MNKGLFVWLLTIIFLATASFAGAQSGKKMPRIGLLTLLSKPDVDEGIFLQGLRDLGYADGQNITIEYRRANGKVEELANLADDLVRSQVDLIVARATPVVAAAKNATTTIPIVIVGAADPVRSGFVASLARPGRNITGLSNIQPELEGKRLELLRELRPKLARVVYLAHKGDPMHSGFIEEAQSAAKRLAIPFQSSAVSRAEELDNAFATIKRERADAVMVQPLFSSNLELGQKVAELAVRHRLLTISGGGGFAEAGGLLLYGPNQSLNFKRASSFVDKILKGAKPSDLPVEQPTKFDFIVNLKTAKRLGVEIPQSILFRADKVIK